MIQDHGADLPDTLSFEEDDPRRDGMEAALYAADLADLRALWRRNREAAAAARRQGEIEKVISLVRGAKTIQRIADERGAVFLIPGT